MAGTKQCLSMMLIPFLLLLEIAPSQGLQCYQNGYIEAYGGSQRLAWDFGGETRCYTNSQHCIKIAVLDANARGSVHMCPESIPGLGNQYPGISGGLNQYPGIPGGLNQFPGIPGLNQIPGIPTPNQLPPPPLSPTSQFPGQFPGQVPGLQSQLGSASISLLTGTNGDPCIGVYGNVCEDRIGIGGIRYRLCCCSSELCNGASSPTSVGILAALSVICGIALIQLFR